VSVCRAQLEARIAEINALMRAHAGGIELLGVSEAGGVSLRFAGKCTGCELRPVTMAATVRPGLLAIEGVTCVTAAGARISEEAELRVAQTLEAARVPALLRGHRASRSQRQS
jgi:Fe-S cluster biogenesis protein NfuA